MIDKWSTASDGMVACDQGCFACGPAGQRRNHVGTDCCHSTLCIPDRWRHQVVNWLTTEERFNIALWLEVEKDTIEAWCAAEEAYRHELLARSKVVVSHVAAAPNNPSRQRETAKQLKPAQVEK